MNKANAEIREMAKKSDVKLWQVAASLKISDVAFCKKLRFELPEKEKEKILQIIKDLAAEKEE